MGKKGLLEGTEELCCFSKTDQAQKREREKKLLFMHDKNMNNKNNHKHIMTIKTDQQEHALLVVTLDLICLQLVFLNQLYPA